MRHDLTINEVRALLEQWGVLMRLGGHLVPESWGWPSESISARIQREGGGAGVGGKPFFTAPERAVHRLSTELRDINAVHAVLRDMKLVPRACVFGRYVLGHERSRIAIRIGVSLWQARISLREAEQVLLKALDVVHREPLRKLNGGLQ